MPEAAHIALEGMTAQHGAESEGQQNELMGFEELLHEISGRLIQCQKQQDER